MSIVTSIVELQPRAAIAAAGEVTDVKCRLFRLPAEIRRHIYSFIFADSEVTVTLNATSSVREQCIYQVHTSSEHQNFLLVSKSCYQEAISTFYAHTTVFIEGMGHETHRLDLWTYVLNAKLPNLRNLATHVAIGSGFCGYRLTHPPQANFSLYDVSQMPLLKTVTFFLRRVRINGFHFFHSVNFYNPKRDLKHTRRQSTRYAYKFANKFSKLRGLTVQFVWCYHRRGAFTMPSSEWLQEETSSKVCKYMVTVGKLELLQASEESQHDDQPRNGIFCKHQPQNLGDAQMEDDIDTW